MPDSSGYSPSARTWPDTRTSRDGSLLVADDWAGAIYRISYGK